MSTRLMFQVRPDGQGPFQCALELTQEYVDVSSMFGETRPNMAWEFVDEAGHYHAFAKDETLPTLDRHVQHIPCVIEHEDPDECSGEDIVSLVCKLCAEPVAPAYVTGPAEAKAIPGRSYWEASIYGVHLEVGSKVSLPFSEPATGRVRWFGIGSVVGNGIETHEGGATYVTKVFGDGALARKK